jgi:serine/threonine protein kinase
MKRCPSCQSAFPTNYTHCPRDGSSLAEASDWSEGTVVRGKYQIIGKVGQGGMAAVYKALHVRFKEVRALKVINPELASDANFVRRFEQEAVITRKLQHPNAVRVDDIDEAEDGRPFIVMEYVEGGNLKDVIELEAPLPVERVCSIVKQVAAALDAAHRLGLVHRDIKPANIALVGSADRLELSIDHVKVLDFGIAKLKEAHLEESKVPMTLMTLTGTGMVIGTPAYMSPEQAKGLKGEMLDGRSDIYSLGVVAYQMLTGDLPLKADSPLELLMAHISTPPKPIHEVRPSLKIPAAIAAVVMRCLEKNRKLRPATGRALINEIETAANLAPALPEKPLAAVTPKQTARFAEPPAFATVAQTIGALRLGWWVWTVAAVLAAATLGSFWYLYEMRPPAEQERQRAAGTSKGTEPVPRVEERPARKPTTQPATRPSEQTARASRPGRSVNDSEGARKPTEPRLKAAGGDDSTPSQATPPGRETRSPAHADGTTAPKRQQEPSATKTTPVGLTRGQIDCTAPGSQISYISLFKSQDIKGDVVGRVHCGQFVEILNQYGAWFEVRSDSGAHGYLLDLDDNLLRVIGESP